MSPPSRAAVLGSGSWGTTFAAVLADAGHQVRVWGRSAGVCRAINDSATNPDYLPGIALPAGISATTDLERAVSGAGLVAVALPAQHVREVLAPLRGRLPADAIVVSLMKGVEVATGELMSEVLAHALDLATSRVAVVSGPNLAREIAVRQPAAAVVAAEQEPVAGRVAEGCATAYFRPYTTTDVTGVELGGAVKNVIALGVGIARGAGYADNTAATLITRGLAETQRLGVAMGAQPETFAGLAGMGDLVATCSSRLSRNNTLGSYVGQGLSLSEATTATGGTAEGVTSCLSVLALARKHGVEMPISEAVAAVLHEGWPVADMTRSLLARPRRPEQD